MKISNEMKRSIAFRLNLIEREKKLKLAFILKCQFRFISIKEKVKVNNIFLKVTKKFT